MIGAQGAWNKKKTKIFLGRMSTAVGKYSDEKGWPTHQVAYK